MPVSWGGGGREQAAAPLTGGDQIGFYVVLSFTKE